MKVKKFQQGGPMDPGMQDPTMQDPNAQGGGVEEQIMAMAQEIIGQVGPEGAMMLGEALMAMAQEAMGAQEQAPAFARKGGTLNPIKK